VELVVLIPMLTTIWIYDSRPIIPVTLAILVPKGPTIRIYDSRPVIPVKLAKVISKSIMVMLKLATGLEEGEYSFPVI